MIQFMRGSGVMALIARRVRARSLERSYDIRVIGC